MHASIQYWRMLRSECSFNKWQFSSQGLEKLGKKLCGFTQTLRLIDILSIKWLRYSSVAILENCHSLLMKDMPKYSLWRNCIWETTQGKETRGKAEWITLSIMDTFTQGAPLLTSHHGEPAHSILACYKFPTKSLLSCYLWFPQKLERRLLKAFSVICALHSLVA